MEVPRLLVLFFVIISNSQLGQCQLDVVRITAAVYELIGPTLEEIQRDIRSVKSDIVTIKDNIETLSQRVSNFTEEVEETALETKLSSNNTMSKIDALEKKIGHANSKLFSLDSKLVDINSTMREELDTLQSAFVDADLEGHLKEMTVQSMSTLSYMLDINSSITNYNMELNKSVNQFQSNLQSMDARVNQNLVSLENRVSESGLVSLPSQLVTLNSTMKDYFRIVRNELNHVNETILGKMNTLYSKFDGTVSENCSVIKSVLISVDSRLDTMNELLRADFNEVKSELSAVSETALAVGDRLESKIMNAQENLTERILGYTCGGTGGWRRVVYLNMTDPSTNCPYGWYLVQNPKRVCFTGRSGCTSEFFPVNGGPYNQVCGRIRAYQRGRADAFYGYTRNGHTTIDGAYFSGVAVMHGNPREHIWTFVAGAYENFTSTPTEQICPCDAISGFSTVPPFLGGDYFCESGYIWPGYQNWTEQNRLHYNDTLWDGKDCHSTSKCCSRHNPPYFTKTLSQDTSNDLELRMCHQNYLALEMVEIYVKQDYVITKLEEIDNKLNVRQSCSIDNLNVHTCGGSGGWRRAVYMNMTDPSTNCPSGWNMTGYSKRSCGRANSSELSCDSVFFPVNGGPYSQVCGRMRAYQRGYVYSFSGFSRSGQTTIDSAYFSGVAVMHGSPRQHVWTFAVGVWENGTGWHPGICPCDRFGTWQRVPPFIGQDYFCESGYSRGFSFSVSSFHFNDTLWDGKDCQTTSRCCSFHNPPYFTKNLTQTTTDDLELRMCLYDPLKWFYTNLGVELIELYVK